MLLSNYTTSYSRARRIGAYKSRSPPSSFAIGLLPQVLFRYQLIFSFLFFSALSLLFPMITQHSLSYQTIRSHIAAAAAATVAQCRQTIQIDRGDIWYPSLSQFPILPPWKKIKCRGPPKINSKEEEEEEEEAQPWIVSLIIFLRRRQGRKKRKSRHHLSLLLCSFCM